MHKKNLELVALHMKQVALAFLLFFWFFSAPLFAFPEMVRQGYLSCASCHVSPDGGGVLTSYGRVLSSEVASHWGNEKEASFLYGLFKTPEWLQLGGDFRAIQTYLNTPTRETYRFIYMQADLEAAASYGKLTSVFSLGWQAEPSLNYREDTLISRRHYLMYRPSDDLSLRFGKFPMAYGIHLADHTPEIRRGLDWDEGTESYNLEGSYLSDPYELFVSATFGRFDNSSLDREKGAGLRLSYSWNERYKAGVSYFYGTNSFRNRHVLGPYAILGFTKSLVLLTEFDFQNLRLSTGSGWALVNYNRLQYEYLKGFHAYLVQEAFNQLDNDLDRLSWGVGLQFLPRPHFEVLLQFQKQRDKSLGNNWNDFGWLLFHFYP